MGGSFESAGVRIVDHDCTTADEAPTQPPRLRLTRDAKAPRGGGAAGWAMRGSGFAVGPLIHVNSPSTLTRLAVSVIARNGSLSGQAVVEYHPTGDSGLWRGTAALGVDSVAGWHRIDAHDLSFKWRYYDAEGDVDDSWSPWSTIGGFTTYEGGDGDGAWVGFVFGCSGETFDLDELTVKSDADTSTIDLEPYGSAAALRRTTGGTKPITIIAGAKAKIRAHLEDEVGKPLVGKMRLQSSPPGGKYAADGTVKVGASGTATTTVSPVRTRVYRLSYAGTSSRVGDTSKKLMVRVRANVRAHLSASKVTSGKPVAIAGKFWPGRPAKLRVQRYFGRKWHTVSTIRSAKDGSYRTSITWQKVGKSYWRVLVPKGGGNLDGHSPAMKLIVKPKPKPPSHGGGGGDNTPTNPTPPPDNNPQPPPPPTGPQ